MFKNTYKFIQLGLKLKKYKSATSEIEKEKVAEYISHLLEEEGGILLKVGQYLGTDDQYEKPIKSLSFRKNQLDIELIKKRIKDSLGLDKFNQINEINENGFSASIGQVHLAKINQNKIAIKVQYPGIEKKLKEQLKALNLIPTGKPAKKFGIDIESYQKMIERKIIGELDYQSEANITKKMAMTLRHSSVIKVPSVFDDFSNENILTTEYFDGFNIDQVMKLDYHSKKSYAENLLTSFLELLKSGVLQADSNHGNFIFLKENYKIGLIDFGQIIEIDQRRKEAFYYLIFNLIKNKSIPYLSVLEEVGFQANRLEAIKDKIPLICSILFQPFLVNKNYYLEDWNYKKKLDQTLGEDKWILRAAGDQDLFLIMKSFMGFKNLIQKIGVPINWQQIFLESTSNMRIQIEEFKPKLIENDNTKEILFSKWINIEIYNDKVLSVSFKLPILEIFDLENQISDEIKLELKSKGIIVAKIINKAINNNAMPQKLFDFTQGKKSYHIFLT